MGRAVLAGNAWLMLTRAFAMGAPLPLTTEPVTCPLELGGICPGLIAGGCCVGRAGGVGGTWVGGGAVVCAGGVTVVCAAQVGGKVHNKNNKRASIGMTTQYLFIDDSSRL